MLGIVALSPTYRAEVYIGRIGTQGGLYSGGVDQILVLKPWMIDGIEVIGTRPIR
jgi:filamentous hemagglutinin